MRYALATALARPATPRGGARELELFDRARRQMLEQRRRDDRDSDVEREEGIRGGLSGASGGAVTRGRRIADRARRRTRRSGLTARISFRSSSTSRARPASCFTTPTARAPRNISSRRWGPAACSSTTTATDGWTSSSSTAGRSPTRPSTGARGTACTTTAATARSRTSPTDPASSTASTAWARAPATTTATAGPTCTSPTTDRTRSTAIDGDGTFTDVTATARVGEPRWSAGCAFADLDRDGDLDLWVVELRRRRSTRTAPFCGDARAACAFYCHPLKYDPLPSTVYRNDGGGVFTDVSAASGVGALRGNGLGVVIADYDDDGLAGRVRRQRHDAELSVPQPRQPGVHRNRARLRHRRRRGRQGARGHGDRCRRLRRRRPARSGDHQPRFRDAHALSRPRARPVRDTPPSRAASAFRRCRLSASASRSSTSTTTRSSTSPSPTGHILDNAPQFRAGSTYMQRKLLFRNTTTRRFVEVGARRDRHSPPRRSAAGSRSPTSTTTATSTCSSPTTARTPSCCATTAETGRMRCSSDLRGAGANTEAIGARIRLTAGSRTQIRDVRGGLQLPESERSARPFRPRRRRARRSDRGAVAVGPDGNGANIAADQIVMIQEGKGLTDRTPFKK